MTDRHAKTSSLAVAGYVILALTVVLALWATRHTSLRIANERAQRSLELNLYLGKQCRRDIRKDAVFVGILLDSIDSVRHRPGLDPALVSLYVQKQKRNIAAIRAVDRQCVEDIPPPLPRQPNQ